MSENSIQRKSAIREIKLDGSPAARLVMPDENSPIRTSTDRNLKTLNAMTVDVEDYFDVSAFEKYIDRSSWDKLECRVERNVDRILSSFSNRNIKGTFFTLGWVAERYPEMTRQIVREGHELASHGWDHVRVTNQTPEQFAVDIQRAKNVLEDVSGQQVLGYRAASYSINETNLWAHDILRESGYLYSSSIAPIKYAEYGIADAPRFAHYRRGEKMVSGPADNAILEIPITTVSLPRKNIPCGGGGWFRLYPYQLSKWALQWVNRHDKQACVFYYHPWEIDLDQPRQENLDWKTRFRHYQNLKHMEGKIEKLLGDFRWGTMQEVYNISAGAAPMHKTDAKSGTKAGIELEAVT